MSEDFKAILKKISRNADGDTMFQLLKRGVKYKRNYGIKLPVLKAIAHEFVPNEQLADEFWASDIREMRILASLLQPVDLLSIEKVNNWAENFNNPEIVEQCCINLFSNSELASSCCSAWFSKPESEEYVKMSAFVLASLLIKNEQKSDDQFINLVLKEALNYSKSDSLHVKNAIIRAIVEVGKLSKEYNYKAIQVVKAIGTQNTENSKFIVDGAFFQLEFFAELL